MNPLNDTYVPFLPSWPTYPTRLGELHDTDWSESGGTVDHRMRRDTQKTQIERLRALIDADILEHVDPITSGTTPHGRMFDASRKMIERLMGVWHDAAIDQGLRLRTENAELRRRLANVEKALK